MITRFFLRPILFSASLDFFPNTDTVQYQRELIFFNISEEKKKKFSKNNNKETTCGFSPQKGTHLNYPYTELKLKLK